MCLTTELCRAASTTARGSGFSFRLARAEPFPPGTFMTILLLTEFVSRTVPILDPAFSRASDPIPAGPRLSLAAFSIRRLGNAPFSFGSHIVVFGRLSGRIAVVANYKPDLPGLLAV